MSFNVQSDIRTQLYRLRDMSRRNGRILCKIGNRPCHFDDTVMRTCREVDAVKCCLEQVFCILFETTIFFYHTVVHLGIAKQPVSLQSLALNDASRYNTLTNRFGGLRPARSMKIRIVHACDTKMKVNAIQQRARQLTRITLDLPNRAFASVILVTVIAAGTTVQITTWV